MPNITEYVERQSKLCEKNDSICKNLYSEYGVKKA